MGLSKRRLQYTVKNLAQEREELDIELAVTTEKLKDYSLRAQKLLNMKEQIKKQIHIVETSLRYFEKRVEEEDD